MAEWITCEGSDLKQAAERLHQTAPLSLKKLMKKAGLTSQSLGHWRTGRSTPQPESIERVAQSLILHGERLSTLGKELLALVEEEELRRRKREAERASEEELSLFEEGAA